MAVTSLLPLRGQFNSRQRRRCSTNPALCIPILNHQLTLALESSTKGVFKGGKKMGGKN